MNSSNLFVAGLYEKVDFVRDFVNLRDENNKIAGENARLRQQLLAASATRQETDSLVASSFNFIPGLIVNNSVNYTNNYITINVGEQDGVKAGMGVISSDGIAGVVTKTSNHYSLVMSLLNQQARISSMLATSNTLGDLVWSSGLKPNVMSLESIPEYVPVSKGDTVITSGYSAIFPKGIPIGVVSSIEEDRDKGFYQIQVLLSTDMHSVKRVYVVENEFAMQVDSLFKDVVDE